MPLLVFILGFTAVSIGHSAYLDAHAQLQNAIQQRIPQGAQVIAGDRVYKSFAPVLGTWRLSQVRDGRLPGGPLREPVFVMWIGPPGSRPPAGWMLDVDAVRVEARSWVWNRDAWIGRPGAELLAAGR